MHRFPGRESEAGNIQAWEWEGIIYAPKPFELQYVS